MKWYCLYTKAKHEDLVAHQLRSVGVEALNAKLRVRKCRSTQIVEQKVPLFPCYLFAKFDANKFSHLISFTRGVRYILGKDRPFTVQDEIIDTIKQHIDRDDTMEIQPPRFEKGDRVLLREGPFKDFYGIFEKEIKGTERVTILLETMNCKIMLNKHYLSNISRQSY